MKIVLTQTALVIHARKFGNIIKRKLKYFGLATFRTATGQDIGKLAHFFDWKFRQNYKKSPTKPLFLINSI